MSEPTYFVPRSVRTGLSRVDEWFHSRQPDTGVELGPSALLWINHRWSLVCLLFLAVALAMPPQGMGVRLCLFHHFSGLDCPGCGMTRGISYLWRGRLLSSVQLHLFAPVAFVFLGVQASSLFMPMGAKRKIVLWIDRHDRWFRFLWVVGGACFFAYGGIRIAYQIFFRG